MNVRDPMASLRAPRERSDRRPVHRRSPAGHATVSVTRPVRLMRLERAPIRTIGASLSAGGCASTVRGRATTSWTPWLSVTRSRAVSVPGAGNVRAALGEAPVLVSKLPSPSRSHSYFAIGASSLEDQPSKTTRSPATAGLGAAVNEAFGARSLRRCR